MKRLLPGLILGAALLAAGALLHQRWYEGRRSEWERDAARETALAREWRERAVRAVAASDSARAAAAAERARADSLAAELAERSRETDARVEALSALPPDTVRDPLIADLRAERDGWREAWEAERRANVLLEQSALGLRHALADALARVDSLVAVVESAPDERAWWVPEIVVGYGAALSGGGVRYGPVVAAGWRVRL